MYSDESSFGWVSVEEEERSDVEDINIGEVQNSTTNLTMVKLEKDISDGEKNYSLVSPSVKYRNVEPNHFINKSEDNEKSTTNNSSLSQGTPRKLPISKDFKNSSFSSSRSLNHSSVGSENKNQCILDQYVKSKDLTILQDIGRCELSADEDIWLVQCPQNIDINILVGQNFLLKDKKRFKIGNSSYECVNSQQNQQEKLSLLIPPTEVTGNYKMNTFVLNGVYFIREKVNSAHDIEVCEQSIEKVPFPTNLKKRHPLLGDNYKPLLKIRNSVKEKLRNPVNKIRKIKKREESNTESEIITEKIKRKRKAEYLDESSEPPQKIKKENVNMWTSELSIEKSLFELLPDNLNKKKSKKY